MKPKLKSVREITIANPRAITSEDIDSHLQVLTDAGLSWWSRNKFTMRTRRHAVAWAKTYVITEAEELDAEFVSRTKGYRVVMIVDNTHSFKLVFRLTTKGLDGWTEYGVEVKRVGSYYACKE